MTEQIAEPVELRDQAKSRREHAGFSSGPVFFSSEGPYHFPVLHFPYPTTDEATECRHTKTYNNSSTINKQQLRG